MQKRLHNKILAGLLTFSLVASGSGIYSMKNGKDANAAEGTALTKVLEAEDINLRATWNDTSNIGAEHTVTLSDGRTITVKDNGSMRKELSSQQLADEEMGMGINLGNTMEAVYAVDYKKTASVQNFETIWGQPVTTREYINCLHTYGINTLRIPVAWSNGDNDDGTYTIRPALLDRVEEIANYALDNGMYVIINDHWDNQWWGQFGACLKDANGQKYADEETRAAAWDRYEAYWTQISERFKDYSDHLILEGANEELGERLNDAICINGSAKGYAKPDNSGTNIETVSGNLSTNELYETTNKINQKFVDIVRSTGGNNSYRHLLIPGYDTNIGLSADSRYKMPTDPVTENGVSKLFLSVHYYTPWDFCGDNCTGEYTTDDQAATIKYFKDLQKFSDAGYGIIIGECGICNPSGVSSSVTQWFLDTFTEAANYHAVPVLWDTGAYFDRRESKINYKDIAVFYNTVNNANGSTDVERISGGVPDPNGNNYDIPAYLDSKLWKTPGLHAYITYQTASWDYREIYTPQHRLSKGKHSWEYIQAGGSEVSASNVKVKDVQLSENGQYTVSIDGIDLSGANYFKWLGVATDIEKKLYPDITITNTTVKFDGEEMTDAPVDLVVKGDNKYYTFMLINAYGTSSAYPLGDENEKETLKIPSKSIEITFTINGLEQVLADVESGEYVNPETGEKLSGPDPTPTAEPTTEPTTEPTVEPTPTAPAPTNPASSVPAPPQNTTAPNPTTGLTAGDTFTAGNYQYKITAPASESGNGSCTLVSLTKKGSAAAKLSVAAAAKDGNGMSYTVNAIGNKAFSGAKATSITLNKNITKIPNAAFAKCKKLKTLTLNAKLSSVSKNAFKGCKKTITVKGKAKSANKKMLKKTAYKKFK